MLGAWAVDKVAFFKKDKVINVREKEREKYPERRCIVSILEGISYSSLSVAIFYASVGQMYALNSDKRYYRSLRSFHLLVFAFR